MVNLHPERSLRRDLVVRGSGGVARCVHRQDEKDQLQRRIARCPVGSLCLTTTLPATIESVCGAWLRFCAASERQARAQPAPRMYCAGAGSREHGVGFPSKAATSAEWMFLFFCHVLVEESQPRHLMRYSLPLPLRALRDSRIVSVLLPGLQHLGGRLRRGLRCRRRDEAAHVEDLVRHAALGKNVLPLAQRARRRGWDELLLRVALHARRVTLLQRQQQHREGFHRERYAYGKLLAPCKRGT